jgi:hypothetical protein
MPARPGAWLGAVAAGLLFFGGAILAHEPAGIGMLVAGVVAALANGAWARHRGIDIGPSVSGFFLGSGLTYLVIFAVIFTVEG